jgi:prevent-host-death family protein
MGVVTVRELRNKGGDVLDRVARGETLAVTRDGVPVAQLSPLPTPPASTASLIARRKHLPHVNPIQLRADIDAVIDPAL